MSLVSIGSVRRSQRWAVAATALLLPFLAVPALAASVPAPVVTAPPSPVAISGPAVVHPVYGTVFTITGTAPARATVTVHFHKAGMPANSFLITRTVVASSSGAWSRAIKAVADYRYYATTGGFRSGTVLNQPTPTVAGAITRLVARGQSYRLSGDAVPNSVVYIHFHKALTPASNYSIVRSVRADGNGRWARSFVTTTDYRLFVARSGSLSLTPSVCTPSGGKASPPCTSPPTVIYLIKTFKR